jgi:dihydrofolate synthase/folylpolyglutamate synthase
VRSRENHLDPVPDDLAGWLDYIERQHPKQIALGLERVVRVRDALQVEQRCPTFIVAGTNGKGSTCAMLESILLAAGYRVGLYTSPHLVRYNERVRIDGRAVDDRVLVDAFRRVESVREGTPLTYFELGTLAAWVIFAAAPLDALVLEIGMGGRLDAVNAFEPDCAILTSIDLDHTEYLGDTREKIGWEKAHVFRTGKPAICGDPQPPATVIDYATALDADLRVVGRDFSFSGDSQQWLFRGTRGVRAGLPYPALRGANQLLNAAAALAGLESLHTRLPVSAQDIRNGLLQVELPGRFQMLPGRPAVILDVAHNPHAAAVLAENLDRMGDAELEFKRTRAVFGMLRDKDIAAVVRHLKGSVDEWYVTDLPGPRGASATALATTVAAEQPWAAVREYLSPRAAYAAAQEASGPDDRIVVFGSFLTVADVMTALGSRMRT